MSITCSKDLRPNPNAENLCSLRFRIIIDRKVHYINTGKRIEPKYWDQKLKKVKPGGLNSMKLNQYLNDELGKIESIILDLQREEQTITIEKIKRRYEMHDGKSDLINYISKIISETKDKYSPKTLDNYRLQLGALKDFSHTIPFSDINDTWLNKFEAYLVKSRKNKINTVAWRMRFLSKFFKLAKKDGLLLRNPFDERKIETETSSFDICTLDELNQLVLLVSIGQQGKDHVQAKIIELIIFHEYWARDGFIQPGVLELIEKLILLQKLTFSTHNSEFELLSAFTFDCYVGLRLGDLSKLSGRNFSNGSIVINKMLKTKEFVTIPLHEKARLIVEERIASKRKKIFNIGGKNEETFLRNSSTFLKRAMRKMGYEKKFTFHTARRTFATLCIHFGIPTRHVSELLGHLDEKSIKPYIQISNTMLVEQMKKFQ